MEGEGGREEGWREGRGMSRGREGGRNGGSLKTKERRGVGARGTEATLDAKEVWARMEALGSDRHLCT